MKLVIEIDEEYYNDIKESDSVNNYSVLYALDAIRNGTPLPKNPTNGDMKVFVVNNPHASWCEDYSVAVIAENSERAIELAKEYSPDYKNAKEINVEVYDLNKEQALLAANVGVL